MIVVIDSGVWISGFHFGGIPQAALNHAYLHHRIALSYGILNEVRSILNRKFLWDNQRADDVLAVYLSGALLLETTGKIRGICRDPNDDMVLECAVIANAQILISGDKDLLSRVSYKTTRILSPRAYLEAEL